MPCTRLMSMLLLKITSDASIRGMFDSDRTHKFSVYDFLTKAKNYKDTGASARKEFARLISDESEYKDEVVALCHYLKFPGSGQRETPCMSIRGLQRLLMILGGKVATEFRKIVEGTFLRVMAGDESLIEEIQANAASDAPLHQVYRQALVQEPVHDSFSLERKRKHEDLETQRLATEIQKQQIENGANLLQNLQMVFSDTVIDERTRLIFKDYFLNLATQNSGLAITNGEQRESPISLSTVAMDMGHRLTDSEAKKIGIQLKRRYIQEHGTPPPKHDQLVGGRVTRVNSYTTRDRAMIEETIKEFMDAQQEEDEASD